MSIAMLKDPLKGHTILDDMESMFWSMLYGAIRYIAGDITLSLEPFFQQQIETINGRLYLVGGDSKLLLLVVHKLINLPFLCGPLRELISQLAVIWGNYYRAFHEKQAFGTEEYQAEYDRQYQLLSKPSFWIAKFDAALAKEGWLPDDVIQDRYPPKPSKQVDEAVRVKLLTAVIASEVVGSRSKTDDNDHADLDDDNAPPAAEAVVTPLTPPDSALASGILDPPPHGASPPLTDLPEFQEEVFPPVPPGPPLSAFDGAGGSNSSGSAPSLRLNSNGKRTMSIRGDDSGEESADGGPQSPLPATKRLKRNLPIRSLLSDVEGFRSGERSGDSRGSVGQEVHARSRSLDEDLGDVEP